MKAAAVQGSHSRKVLKKDVQESRHDQLSCRLLCELILIVARLVRYQTKDWAGLQEGRLRATLALSARMTKRTTIARRVAHRYVAQRNPDPKYSEAVWNHCTRSEEMQAIKNFIAGLQAFQVGKFSDFGLDILQPI